MSARSAGSPPLPNLPNEAWLAALAALPGIGPARLRALVEAFGAAGAWGRLVRGGSLVHPAVEAATGGALAGLVSAWRRAARLDDPEARWRAHGAAGISVIGPGDPRFPLALRHDPDPPSVLFAAGDPEALEAPLVAVVGTRRCTRYGHDIARRFGRELAAAGVGVVSGLAAGIDAAVHAGSLESSPGTAAGPVAVVGSGLDVVYPSANRELWRRVRERGLLLSEAPLGTRPEPWRFPARNRIIAALSRAVVVVESPGRGGSLLTAGEALDRGVTVLAVPGPISSRASAGTNALIADGAAPALDIGSVLLAAGIEPAVSVGEAGSPPAAAGEPVEGDEAVLLDALGFQARSFAELAERVPWPVPHVAAVLESLLVGGHIARNEGWYERACVRETDGGG